MLPQNTAQGRVLMAAQERVATQRQKLTLSACNKDLERVGGGKKRGGLGILGQRKLSKCWGKGS